MLPRRAIAVVGAGFRLLLPFAAACRILAIRSLTVANAE